MRFVVIRMPENNKSTFTKFKFLFKHVDVIFLLFGIFYRRYFVVN